MIFRLCIILTAVFASCSRGDQPARDGRLDLLLKKQTPLLGIYFRLPCRIADIKSYSWAVPYQRPLRSACRLRLQLTPDTPVLSPAPGRVTFLAGSRSSMVFTLEITHSERVKTVLYGVRKPGVKPGSILTNEGIIGQSTGILDIQVYVKKSLSSLTVEEHFLRDITRREVWTPVFTPLIIIGKGGAIAITNH